MSMRKEEYHRKGRVRTRKDRGSPGKKVPLVSLPFLKFSLLLALLSQSLVGSQAARPPSAVGWAPRVLVRAVVIKGCALMR